MHESHLMRVKQLIMRWSKLPSLQGAVCPCIIAIYMPFGWGETTPEMEAGSSLLEPSQPKQVPPQVGRQCGSSLPWSLWLPTCLPLLNTPHSWNVLYTWPGSEVASQLLPLPSLCSPGLSSYHVLPAVPWPMPAAHLEHRLQPPLPAEVLVHPDGGMSWEERETAKKCSGNLHTLIPVGSIVLGRKIHRCGMPLFGWKNRKDRIRYILTKYTCGDGRGKTRWLGTKLWGKICFDFEMKI